MSASEPRTSWPSALSRPANEPIPVPAMPMRWTFMRRGRRLPFAPRYSANVAAPPPLAAPWDPESYQRAISKSIAGPGVNRHSEPVLTRTPIWRENGTMAAVKGECREQYPGEA